MLNVIPDSECTTVKHRPFIGLLIDDVINLFMFSHELNINYILFTIYLPNKGCYSNIADMVT